MAPGNGMQKGKPLKNRINLVVESGRIKRMSSLLTMTLDSIIEKDHEEVILINPYFNLYIYRFILGLRGQWTETVKMHLLQERG